MKWTAAPVRHGALTGSVAADGVKLTPEALAGFRFRQGFNSPCDDMVFGGVRVPCDVETGGGSGQSSATWS
jgi:hypothetical protein